jgi:protein CpxP
MGGLSSSVSAAPERPCHCDMAVFPLRRERSTWLTTGNNLISMRHDPDTISAYSLSHGQNFLSSLSKDTNVNKLSSYALALAMTAATAMTAVTAGGAFAADAANATNAAGKSGDGPHMGWHKMSPEKMREHMAKRQAKLHDQLKLSAAQEPAWKTFVSAMTPNDMGRGWAHGDRAAMEKMSAPERMEKHLQMSRERDARMSARLAATKTFYATLSPEQQQVFNTETMHGRHHGHHGQHGQQKESNPRANG